MGLFVLSDLVREVLLETLRVLRGEGEDVGLCTGTHTYNEELGTESDLDVLAE